MHLPFRVPPTAARLMISGMRRLLYIVSVVCLLFPTLLVGPAKAQQQVQRAGNAPATTNPSLAIGQPSSQLAGVTFSEGRLSLKVQNIPLASLGNELSQRAGIVIMPVGDAGNELISASFENLPLDLALRRILAKDDAFFFYGVDEDKPSVLKAVWVYPKGKGAGMAPVPPERWRSTEEAAKMLKDSNPEVRGRAIETLVERKQAGATQLVINALHDNNDQVRQRALFGALKAGVDLPPPLIKDMALSDSSADVRFLALQAASNGPDARGTAEAALHDPSEPVRNLAREIISRLDEQTHESEGLAQPPTAPQQENQSPQEGR